MGCWHHTRARSTWETGGRWSREWRRRHLSLLKCSGYFVQSGSELALPSVSESSLSHSLCVSDYCSVSFS